MEGNVIRTSYHPNIYAGVGAHCVYSDLKGNPRAWRGYWNASVQ